MTIRRHQVLRGIGRTELRICRELGQMIEVQRRHGEATPGIDPRPNSVQ